MVSPLTNGRRDPNHSAAALPLLLQMSIVWMCRAMACMCELACHACELQILPLLSTSCRQITHFFEVSSFLQHIQPSGKVLLNFCAFSAVTSCIYTDRGRGGCCRAPTASWSAALRTVEQQSTAMGFEWTGISWRKGLNGQPRTEVNISRGPGPSNQL